MPESDKIDENLCQTSLPEGLQELMSDITREVLRAQPQNVYSFITNYLAALLEIRNNISIAADLCNDIDKFSYQTTLVEELKDIGLSEEEVVKALDIITDFLENNKVKETNQLIQVLRKTSIEEGQLQPVQSAVHKSCQKHRSSQSQIKLASRRITVCDNVSLTSLAGSYVTLPKHRPYSAHDNLSNVSERNTSDAAETHNMIERHDKTDININSSDEETDSDTSSFKTVKFSMTYS